MLKRLTILLTICLTVATAVQAQPGGGGGRGRGGGGGGRSSPPPAGASGPAKAAKPFAAPEIIGVIKVIEADTGRVTITYEPVEALNWPAGTQPFVVGKTTLLKDLAVGEKVRFSLESQQIAAIRPF